MASEALATERIEDQDAQGYSACRQETSLAARSIKGAIDLIGRIGSNFFFGSPPTPTPLRRGFLFRVSVPTV
jgi:hypothetical protein